MFPSESEVPNAHHILAIKYVEDIVKKSERSHEKDSPILKPLVHINSMNSNTIDDSTLI